MENMIYYLPSKCTVRCIFCENRITLFEPVTEATSNAILAKSNAVPEITVIIWNPIGTMITPKTAIPKIIIGNIRCRCRRRASFAVEFKLIANDWYYFRLIFKSLPFISFTWLMKNKAYSMRFKNSINAIDCLFIPWELFWCYINIFPRF